MSEAFADRTNEAARAGNWSAVKDQTEFMATEYCNGPDCVKALVDVAYAENLMWDLDNATKTAAWPYVAKEVRDLHERMWGDPSSRAEA
ncbi:DUF7674 family protein [Ramlibacter tataouinensis]|uniref:DUF7674 family protein n=1 Tax=Ramlibacter tataouinensis TaxID=94132 RepID=UPI00118071FD|nr:hypothetical protein [Ramlibacter tataouinensis]